MSIKVYLAGSIRATKEECPLIGALENLGKGIEMAKRLLLLGYYPFCPFLDFMYFMMLKNGEKISLAQIQAYSKEFLKVCQVIYVLPKSEESLGTQAEIELAKSLNIPIVYNEDDLQCVRNRILGVVNGV